jgi:hypothetical protein
VIPGLRASSDPTPTKQPNKSERSPAAGVEGRPPTKENTRQSVRLRERLRKFGLELHPEKTRLIEFGRYAAERREKRGEGKPETFHFLGFTHICGASHRTGYFTVHRRTIGKRMATKLKDIRAKLQQRMHAAPTTTGKWLVQSGAGVFPISRHPGQLGTTEGVSPRRAAHVVSSASTTKPGQPPHLGTFRERLGRHAATGSNPATLSQPELRCPIPQHPR